LHWGTNLDAKLSLDGKSVPKHSRGTGIKTNRKKAIGKKKNLKIAEKI